MFTGDSGEQYGYSDQWDDQGVFHYVGEGQVGDMEFKAGNKAVRNHALDGKELLLFETLGKGKPVRFLGSFQCASWETKNGIDRNGDKRILIVFHLIPTSNQQITEFSDQNQKKSISLDTLKKRAYSAANQSPKGSSKRAQQTYYQRSQSVKDYVLARANGICESCNNDAPFKRQNNSPYLEPHHTRRIADSGPDHPRWVGAICPNCHREIHFGLEGDLKNRRLMKYLGAIESEA